MTKQIQWYASGGGIALSGPFATQADAWKAMRLAPGYGSLFPSDVKIWPDDRTRAEISKALDDDRKARDASVERGKVLLAVGATLRRESGM